MLVNHMKFNNETVIIYRVKHFIFMSLNPVILGIWRCWLKWNHFWPEKSSKEIIKTLMEQKTDFQTTNKTSESTKRINIRFHVRKGSSRENEPLNSREVVWWVVFLSGPLLSDPLRRSNGMKTSSRRIHRLQVSVLMVLISLSSGPRIFGK